MEYCVKYSQIKKFSWVSCDKSIHNDVKMQHIKPIINEVDFLDSPLIFQMASRKRLGSFGICSLGKKCICSKHHSGDTIGEKEVCQYDFDNCLDTDCEKIHFTSKNLHPSLFAHYFQIWKQLKLKIFIYKH